MCRTPKSVPVSYTGTNGTEDLRTDPRSQQLKRPSDSYFLNLRMSFNSHNSSIGTKGFPPFVVHGQRTYKRNRKEITQNYESLSKQTLFDGYVVQSYCS